MEHIGVQSVTNMPDRCPKEHFPMMNHIYWIQFNFSTILHHVKHNKYKMIIVSQTENGFGHENVLSSLWRFYTLLTHMFGKMYGFIVLLVLCIFLVRYTISNAVEVVFVCVCVFRIVFRCCCNCHWFMCNEYNDQKKPNAVFLFDSQSVRTQIDCWKINSKHLAVGGSMKCLLFRCSTEIYDGKLFINIIFAEWDNLRQPRTAFFMCLQPKI